ncbi:MAG TPA: MFS transporter [Terracidiphilus sp.]|nr:MFS transporter [Terracidiphilus sp.]
MLPANTDVPGSGALARIREYAESRWLGKRFSGQFWVFFSAAFLYDFGFGLYFFLFNLFLANLHYMENILGLVTGALTMGNVAGSIPASLLARRFGLQKTLLVGFVAAPLICILRTLIFWMPAQIGLAFLAGFALSTWTVCFSPTVARLTTEENRVSGFSIVFATGIGSGTLAGLVGGYLPELLKATSRAPQLAGNIRVVLLVACGVTMLGIVPILRLRLGPAERAEKRTSRLVHPFLYRFLPPFFLWSAVTGSFTPFAAVYLQRHLKIPLTNVGVIFSASQLAQLAGALLAPYFFRKLGTVVGIMCMQLATAVSVFALGCTQNIHASVLFYLGFVSFQFMSGPGIYSLLMSRLPDEDRSAASAIQNMTGALSHAGVAVITGIMLVKYGYPKVLAGNAGVAVAAALLLFLLLRSVNRQPMPAAQVVEMG